MRPILWLLFSLVLLVALGAAASFFLFIEPALPGGIYPAGSKIEDEKALGGFSRSENFPKEFAGRDWGKPGAVSLVAFPDETVTYADRQGFAVRLINRTDHVIGFTASDSRLYLTQEALAPDGAWHAVELPPEPICGNSFHRVFLDKNHYWEFPALLYGGTRKTKLRFRLDQGKLDHEAFGPGEPPLTLPATGGEIIYSNEFDGWAGGPLLWLGSRK